MDNENRAAALELERVTAELAFAVGTAGAYEAFTALAELMKRTGHSADEISAAFVAFLRVKRFSTPTGLPGDEVAFGAGAALPADEVRSTQEPLRKNHPDRQDSDGPEMLEWLRSSGETFPSKNE
jgi:hypothetical protein